MDHAEARELLELGAVEPAGLDRLMAGDTPQAAALAGHLAGCPDCSAEMTRLREVAGIVRGVVRTTPPPDLRERTLSLVREVGRDRSGRPAAAGATVGASASAAAAFPASGRLGQPLATDRTTGRRGVSALPLLAVAAALVIAVLGTGLVVSSQKDAAIARLDAAIQKQAEAVNDLGTVTAWTLRVDGRPDAHRVDLASAIGGTPSGTLVFSPSSRELVVVASGLSEPPPGREYRCWLEAGGQRQPVGKMFFGGGLSYWVGKVEAVAGLGPDVQFGISLVDLAAPSAPGDPVLSGRVPA
ncbi:MAG: anti-sigma factor [Chloroflexota bacterium]|nr:anti-sigma factor [Chloroflexota bacterium]